MLTAPLNPAPTSTDPPGEDARLLAEARGGSEAAFTQLVRQHQASVFTLALRFTGNRADAEELAQDTFLQAHSALPQISTPLHLRHWLLRAVSHRSLNRLRERERRPRFVSVTNVAEAAATSVAAPDVDHLAAARLHGLLLQLAPDARAVMLLRLQEDLDPNDIASVLAMPLNTVKSHLRRSLDWLRTQYVGENHGI